MVTENQSFLFFNFVLKVKQDHFVTEKPRKYEKPGNETIERETTAKNKRN